GQASALASAQVREFRCHGRQELAPRAYPAAFHDGLRAVGIVQRKNRGLVEGTRSTEAGWMVGVAFDLRRPAEVAFDQDARRVAPQRRASGEILRFSG